MLPTGTVTLVFTDIEGSTQLLQQAPEEFPALLEKHHQLIRDAFTSHGGIEVDNTGDGFFFVFEEPNQAVLASARAQNALNSHPWKAGRIVRVRMGIHTGVVQLSEDTYIGLDVHKAARIMAAAYGGQVLISQSVATGIHDQELDGISLFALGEFLLKDLPQPEVLYQLLLEGAASVLPEPRTIVINKTNLPSRATSLIGRQAEIENVLSQIRRPDVRLITMVGPGGIGKTSLAIESGRVLTDEFHDGVYIVFLAPVTDAQFVPSAIAQVLGFFLHTGIPVIDQLKEYIAERKILLILDNFEHLTQASPMIAQILEGCPNLKILATSRIVLRLQWEWEYPVPPLPFAKTPNKKKYDSASLSPSVELFVQRAHAIDPHFTPVGKDYEVIAEICDRLDGLPLAIELAAARIKVLSPKTILSRLCKRLDLLRGGRSDLPERHQTLRHAVGWSYDLLKKDEQSLFRKLGVYAGGFTLEAAEAVHTQMTGKEGDGLDIIISLRDQSLIRISDTKSVEPRYMILETIREYALEQLMHEGEIEEARKAHAAWYLGKAEEASLHFNGPDSRMWLDAVEADLDNYRAALKWAAESTDATTGLRLCNALWRFWVIRAFLQEGVSQLQTQLANATGTHLDVLRATALNAYGTLLHELSDYKGAYESLTEAVNILRRGEEKIVLATALNNLGWVAGQIGNLDEAEKYSREAYEIHLLLDNKRGMGVSMNNMGFICFSKSDYDQMRQYYQKHYALMEEIGDKRSMGYSLLCQTYGEQDSGDIQSAQLKIDRATQLILEVDDRQLIGWATTLQALLFFHTRKFENARQYLRDTVEEATLLHNRLIVSLELVLLGASEMKLDNLQQAKTYLNEALGYARVRGSRILEGMATRHLAECALKEGLLHESMKFIAQSYHARKQIQNTIGIVDCGELLARVFYHQKRYPEAVQLLACCTTIRTSTGFAVQQSQEHEINDCYDLLRRELNDEDFQEAWKRGTIEDLSSALEKYLEFDM
jgi:predicted ATPase/class 3 adenylate cyclase